jgi:hypothetical protein
MSMAIISIMAIINGVSKIIIIMKIMASIIMK